MTQAAGTSVSVVLDGEEILSFTPDQEYQNLLISSDDLLAGTTYEVYIGSSDHSASPGRGGCDARRHWGTSMTDPIVTDCPANLHVTASCRWSGLPKLSERVEQKFFVLPTTLRRGLRPASPHLP